MTIVNYILVLAIANLITEQTITRRIILYFFKPENYLQFSGIKRFIFDLLSCPVCISFHIGYIYALLSGFSLPEALKMALICMFIYDVILKIKR